MNLQQLINGTRRVKSDGTWDTRKDFRSKEFGPIISINLKGNYNAHFKTLSVVMYIKSKSQKTRGISESIGSTAIATHSVGISFRNIEQVRIDNVQSYIERYNNTDPKHPIADLQGVIDKMKELHPDLVPVDIGEDYIVFRTKITLATECRVRCTCAHFYYTFAYYNAQARAYIGETPAPYNSKRKQSFKVRSRNVNGVAGLCKHLQLLVSYILKPDNGINGDIEYANRTFNVPLQVKEEMAINRNVANIVKEYKETQKDEQTLSSEIRKARRDFHNFNEAVRQQKVENKFVNEGDTYDGVEKD